MQDAQIKILSDCFGWLCSKSRKAHAPISRYMTSLSLSSA